MLDAPHTSQAQQERGVRLLDAMPDLELAISDGERTKAHHAIVAPVRVLPPGPFEMTLATEPTYPFAMVLLSGSMLRNTYLRERPASEILGAGDLVETHVESEPQSVTVTTEYVVHEETTVALLDDRFRRAARRWPALYDVVHAQLSRQRRRASTHLAILHLPRVENRVLALFTDLADRWGRVTSDGIVVDIALTHDVLGRLVGSRRPTVTLALTELAEAGLLTRAAGGPWVLSRAALAV